MTDAQFEAYMAKLLRAVNADTRGATPLGRRYAFGPAGASTPASREEQRETRLDHETHKHNDEWTRT